MACPLYQPPPTTGNPLRVCGPKERIGFAPSLAHLKIFCESVSAYLQCPLYKMKTPARRKERVWVRSFKWIADSLLRTRKEKEDGVSKV